MFNPLKGLGDINEMRKKAQAIQKALEDEMFEETRGNVKVEMNGNMNVKRVEIDGENNNDLVRALNDVIKRAQTAAAGKLMQMK